MIPYSRQSIDQSDIDAVVETLRGDFLTGGQKVSDFEEALERYLGVKHVCVMNSATSALHVTYQVIGLKEGDEVITTPLTFAATSNTAIQCGATPVFCDIRYDGNIDERKLEALITPHTKAIAPVDFGGNPLPIGIIKTLCDKHKLFLIEDASHALGSEIDGKKVGQTADMTIFSFHAIKPITTFEGGAIATNNTAFYEQAKLLRSHGIVKKELWNSDMITLGENYRLSDVACALGLSQLKRLESFIQKRNEIAHYYDTRFTNNPFFSTITIESSKRSARHLYPILLDRSLWCAKEEIFKALHAKGLGIQVHYKPVYQFSYYQKKFGEQRLETTEDFYRAELSIPCHQGMRMEEAVMVADTVLETVASLKGCKR